MAHYQIHDKREDRTVCGCFDEDGAGLLLRQLERREPGRYELRSHLINWCLECGKQQVRSGPCVRCGSIDNHAIDLDTVERDAERCEICRCFVECGYGRV